LYAAGCPDGAEVEEDRCPEDALRRVRQALPFLLGGTLESVAGLQNLPGRLPSQNDDSSYPAPAFSDPYGNTIFNRIQSYRFLCRDEGHSDLKFFGNGTCFRVGLRQPYQCSV